MKIKPLKKAFMRTLLSANSGSLLRFIGFLCQACSELLLLARPVIHSVPQVNVYNRGAIVSARLSAPMRRRLWLHSASENQRLMGCDMTHALALARANPK